MRVAASVLLACAVTLSLACGDRKPAQFTHDIPSGAVTNASFFTAHAQAVNGKGEALARVPVAFAGGPADVLEVSDSGQLRCAKTGDATVTLTADGLSQRVPVRCRIPTEIRMPPELEVVMGAAPAALHVVAVGDGGKPLDEVEVAFASSDPAVLAVDGDRVRGLAIGRTRLSGSAGGITGVTQVVVVETIASGPLKLQDGETRTFNLQAGRYRVTVDLKADERIKQGVTLTWSGTACDNQIETPAQRQICRVADTATLTIANPRTMGLGATVTGTFAVHRLPD